MFICLKKKLETVIHKKKLSQNLGFAGNCFLISNIGKEKKIKKAFTALGDKLLPCASSKELRLPDFVGGHQYNNASTWLSRTTVTMDIPDHKMHHLIT